MSKATIQAFGPSSVKYVADNGFGEIVPRLFYVSGGYVREDMSAFSGSAYDIDVHVCEFLGYRGNTLQASDGDELLALVRSEHKRAMARRRREDRRQAD